MKLIIKILQILNLKLVFFDKYLQAIRDENTRIKQGREIYIRAQLSKFDLDYNSLSALSNSELEQDLFVISVVGKLPGFFVDIGAADGLSLSNTKLLEDLGWKGILVEPSKHWHPILKNRLGYISHCAISQDDSGKNFLETTDPYKSTLYENLGRDKHERRAKSMYGVPTITLLNLLEKYNAPNVIDYLSIDTEGNDFEVIQNFDFNLYKFKVITIEHNFTDSREKIYNLLTANGYSRVLEYFSRHDDFYVLESALIE